MERTRPTWVDDALYPFKDHFLDIDRHTVHYVDEGDGPVLLMLHGNPTWSFVYRDVIKALSDRFRCVAPDYPGFGLSTAAIGYGYRPADQADVVLRLVEALDLRDVILVMQDWGGPIGLWVAEQIPERFSGLVVGNTWGWPVNGDRHFSVFSWLMGGPIGTPLIKRFNLFVNVMLPAGHRRRKLSPGEMAHYREPTREASSRRATAVFPREIIGSRDFLAGIESAFPTIADLPALIIWADRDIAFRAQERERWETLLADHETVVLSGAGHYLQSDAPDEFAVAIMSWHAHVDTARQ